MDEELAFCTHRSNGLWDQFRHVAGEEATREKREAVHRAAGFQRQAMRRNFARRDAYGGDAPGSAPVSSGSSSAGGYGGASGGVSAGGSSGGSSSGGACSCSQGQAGPPGVRI